MENITNDEKTNHMQKDDVTHDVANKYDVTYDVVAYLSTWYNNMDIHDNIEPDRKPQAYGIRIPN